MEAAASAADGVPLSIRTLWIVSVEVAPARLAMILGWSWIWRSRKASGVQMDGTTHHRFRIEHL